MNSQDVPVESAHSDLVPLAVLEKVADAHAWAMWGENIDRGAPIPLSDASGVYAYLFPYILGTRQFPAHDAVLGQLRALRERYHVEPVEAEIPPDYLVELSHLGSRFGSVCVSARLSAGPVLWMAHFLPQYFLTGEVAREEASRRLGGEVALRRYYAFSPEVQFFEFASGAESVLVDAVLPGRDVPDGALERAPRAVRPAELVSDSRTAWVRLTTGAPEAMYDAERLWLAPGMDVAPVGIPSDDIAHTHTEKRVAYWELIPKVNHTSKNWCVPSSWAMILGFYDHYVKGKGTLLGYGRLIDHWYELTPGGHNLPNLIDELLTAPGAAVVNNYTFTEANTNGDKGAQWAMLKGEIDAGRPCFFNVPGHTTAAFGYQVDAAGQKFAIVYDPPNPSVPTYVNYINLQECEGVARLTLSGATDAENLVIMGPDSSESLHVSVPGEIKWFVWGNSIQKARLSLSEDGGNHWQVVADSVPAKAGLNRYYWMPPSGSRIRVKVEGFAPGGGLIAADGSESSLTVQAQAGGGSWSQIYGKVGTVLAGYDKAKAARLIYVTDAASGDVFQFMGKPGVYWNWIQVGGPGKAFVLDGQGKLYGLSPDGGGVFQYAGSGSQWTQIGGAAKEIYPDVDGVCLIHPSTGDVYRYLGTPFSWRKVGGPGKSFACDGNGMLYGVAPDGSGVWRYDGLFGAPVPWVKVGGPATRVYARGCGVYATNPQTGDIYAFHGHSDKWTRAGGPGKEFSVDVEGRLYGLAPDGSKVWRYDGSLKAPVQWTQIGGAAAAICAGWREVLAVNPATKELWIYLP